MSAGTGVFHSEHNFGDKLLRILQIWVFPDKKGYEPNYGDHRFKWELRKNKWLPLVSGQQGDAPIKINQDANFYVVELEKGNEITFEVNKGRQAYLVQIEGKSQINDIIMNGRDGLESVEENINIKANETSHILVIEMKKA